MSHPLTASERAQAIAALDRIEAELSQISTWLGQADEDRAAIVLECAWRDVMAAARVVERPENGRPRGWLSQPRTVSQAASIPGQINGHGTYGPMTAPR